MRRDDGAACEPPELEPGTCTDKSIQAAKQKYYRTDEPHCLYAGNFTHFRNGIKRAGNCEPPKAYCAGSTTCRGPKDQPAPKKNFECTATNEVICNPFVFNLDENNKALCVPSGEHATAACTDKADKIDKARLEASQAQQRKTLQPVTDWVQTSFLARVTNVSGLIESWSDFRTQINKMCFEGDAKDVYCRECDMMKRRLFKMHLVTRGKGQNNAQAGDCLKLIEISRRSQQRLQDNTGNTTAPAAK